jgi:hypothetical protein
MMLAAPILAACNYYGPVGGDGRQHNRSKPVRVLGF